MKRLAIYILALFALLGCVHYEEEIWLNRDGSGRAEVRIVHRSNYAQGDYIDRLASRPGISLQKKQIRRIGEDIEYIVSFKFSSIEALNNLNDRIGMADFAGKIILEKGKDHNIHFSREINYQGEEGDEEFSDIFRMRNVEDPSWSYTLHLPWKILSANADRKDIDFAKKTVKWSFMADDIWHKPQTMSIEVRKDFPWLPLALGVIAVILILCLVLWMIRITRRSHLIDRWLHHQEHGH